MGILNSSGRSFCSKSDPWEALEAGTRTWHEFLPDEQERLVQHYAPKIRYLALHLKSKLPRNVELNELISAGTLGLMEALGKFEAERGFRFETYAENRIRGAMLDELRRMDWFPRGLRQKGRVLDQAMRFLESAHGCLPTETELQEYTGMTLKDVRQGLEILQNHLCISLDAVEDVLAQDPGDMSGEPFHHAATGELVERVAALIDALTPREKLVLSLYYSDELNMREAAAVMGITEGRVSQLHSQALGRLRREFYSQYGEHTIL